MVVPIAKRNLQVILRSIPRGPALALEVCIMLSIAADNSTEANGN